MEWRAASSLLVKPISPLPSTWARSHQCQQLRRFLQAGPHHTSNQPRRATPRRTTTRVLELLWCVSHGRPENTVESVDQAKLQQQTSSSLEGKAAQTRRDWHKNHCPISGGHENWLRQLHEQTEALRIRFLRASSTSDAFTPHPLRTAGHPRPAVQLPLLAPSGKALLPRPLGIAAADEHIPLCIFLNTHNFKSRQNLRGKSAEYQN